MDYTINLDFDQPTTQKTDIVLNQANLKNVRFMFRVYKGPNELQYTLFNRAEMVFQKPDRSNVVENGVLSTTGISYLLNNEIFSAPGWVTAYINLYTAAGVRAATLYYNFLVVSDLLDLDKISQSYVSPIEIIVQQIKDQLQQLTIQAQQVFNDIQYAMTIAINNANNQIDDAINSMHNDVNTALNAVNAMIKQAQDIIDSLMGEAYASIEYVNNAIAAGNFAVKNGILQANLNADMLDGNHANAFATPASVATQIAGANHAVKDGTLQSNLNADLLDGIHRGDGGAANYIPWFNASEKMFVRGSGKSVLQIGNQNALSVCDPYANISWAFNAYSDNANAMHYISTSTHGARGLTMNYASPDLLYWNIAPGTSTTADATFSKTDYKVWTELSYPVQYGTFTPTLTGSTADPVLSFIMQYGAYIKVGRVVTIHVYIRASVTTAGTGYLYVATLPFAFSSTGTGTHYAWAAITHYSGFPTAVVEISGQIGSSNTTSVLLYNGTTTAGIQPTAGSTIYLGFSMSYLTA